MNPLVEAPPPFPVHLLDIHDIYATAAVSETFRFIDYSHENVVFEISRIHYTYAFTSFSTSCSFPSYPMPDSGLDFHSVVLAVYANRSLQAL